MEQFELIAQVNQKRANEIVHTLEIVETWATIGANANLVGSLRMGLLATHRDIDFHIYSKDLSVQDSFAVITKFAQHNCVTKVLFSNLLNTEENCLEWHLFYNDEDGQEWQLDMIHMLQGSAYDGYFESVAEKIMAQLTPELRHTILRLKYETPASEKIIGIEYYKAVIQDDVRTYQELQQWRLKHPAKGIIEW